MRQLTGRLYPSHFRQLLDFPNPAMFLLSAPPARRPGVARRNKPSHVPWRVAGLEDISPGLLTNLHSDRRPVTLRAFVPPLASGSARRDPEPQDNRGTTEQY